ncbi:MAG TPA: hypothetical protein VF503_08920 [Sphingobium sp.]|uniref:hypothetical protein n=1 Tax=Sphingobium sp. TaxID=1912891 RepID=UPI002ED239F3
MQPEWQDIATARKSTSEPHPNSRKVKGVYLLGFIPDPDAIDPQSCISVIWWEPHMGPRKQGCWVTDATCIHGEGVQPTHWAYLPEAPQ